MTGSSTLTAPNSLECGRLLLEVDLGCGVNPVSARLVNNAKIEDLERVKGSNDLLPKTFVTTLMVQESQRPGRWTGELNTPSSWVEVGRRNEKIRKDLSGEPPKREPLYARDNIRA